MYLLIFGSSGQERNDSIQQQQQLYDNDGETGPWLEAWRPHQLPEEGAWHHRQQRHLAKSMTLVDAT